MEDVYKRQEGKNKMSSRRIKEEKRVQRHQNRVDEVKKREGQREIEKENICQLQNIHTLNAVSYTHLDVYKRQN